MLWKHEQALQKENDIFNVHSDPMAKEKTTKWKEIFFFSWNYLLLLKSCEKEINITLFSSVRQLNENERNNYFKQIYNELKSHYCTIRKIMKILNFVFTY